MLIRIGYDISPGWLLGRSNDPAIYRTSGMIRGDWVALFPDRHHAARQAATASSHFGNSIRRVYERPSMKAIAMAFNLADPPTR